MKIKLLLCIFKNIGKIFTISFWKTYKNDPQTGLIFLLLIIIGGISDILKILTRPGFPKKIEEG